MDITTIGGILAAFAFIIGAILLGGDITAFFDLVSVIIVVGGTSACLFVGFPLASMKNAAKGVRRAFFLPRHRFDEAVRTLAQLSQRARREGLLSLESAAEESDDEFLQRGLRLMVDGHEPSTVESVLYDEIAKMEERQKVDAAVFDGLGSYAPAMGMIGTLVGLVLMLKDLHDPSAIGPAMAVALLTTFYGALIANIIGIPIGNKLKLRTADEIAYRELLAQGMLSILAGENPRFMVERLNATLPPEHRLAEAA